MDKMLKTVTHPFVPNQVAFARREVMLTKIGDRGSAAARRENDARSGFSTPPPTAGPASRDWIVYRTLGRREHLWQIVETLDTAGRDHIVVSPVGDSSRRLFGAGESGQIEALTTAGSFRRSTTWTCSASTC